LCILMTLSYPMKIYSPRHTPACRYPSRHPVTGQGTHDKTRRTVSYGMPCCKFYGTDDVTGVSVLNNYI
ncbi:MAG: hypothetical protein WCA39_08900, partial [Nitrososphaeraceae archaeon]